MDIIPLNSNNATVIHLGGISLEMSDITVSSVTIRGITYADCRAIGGGNLSYSI